MPVTIASWILLGAALAAGVLTAIPARADDGPVTMRLRGVYLDFAQQSDSIPPLGLPSDASTGKIHLDSSSFGFAGQLGFDYRLVDHWVGNIEVKDVTLKSDVTTDHRGRVSTVHLDPWLLGIGARYRC